MKQYFLYKKRDGTIRVEVGGHGQEKALRIHQGIGAMVTPHRINFRSPYHNETLRGWNMNVGTIFKLNTHAV